MHPVRIVASLLAVALIVGACSEVSPPRESAVSREALPIRDVPSCPACGILVEREVILGNPLGEGLLGDMIRPWRLPDGRYLVTSHPEHFRVQVFDSSGVHLTAFGREGDGPGEWRMARAIVAGDERMFVLDTRRNVHVLDADLRHVDQFRIPFTRFGAWSAVGDSLLALHAPVAEDPSLIGTSFHVLDAAGRIVRSFDEAQPPVTPLTLRDEHRHMHYGGDGTLWTVTSIIEDQSYRLDQWSVMGTHLGAWIRRSDGLRDLEAVQRRGEPWPPPTSGVWALTMDGEGRLWVFSQVPDSRWPAAMVLDSMRSVWTVGDPNRFLDTLVDVIDPGTGTLIVSERIDLSVVRVFGSDGGARLATVRYDDSGHNYLDVWRLTLTPGASRP